MIISYFFFQPRGSIVPCLLGNHRNAWHPGRQSVGRCHHLLVQLNALELPYTIIKKLNVGAIRKFRKHETLASLSRAIIHKWQNVYYTDLMKELDEAVTLADVRTTQVKLKSFCRLSEKNSKRFFETFNQEQNLVKIVVRTAY
jgi:hypothetical protein